MAQALIDFELFTTVHEVRMGIDNADVAQPFCHVGRRFGSVEDIPSDTSGCEWGQASIGPNYGQSIDEVQDGYIVRDRSQSKYWRLRVDQLVFFDAPPSYEAVFEVAEFGDPPGTFGPATQTDPARD